MMLVSFGLFSVPCILTLITTIFLEHYVILVINLLFYFLVIFNLFRGGCTDPGILPRQNNLTYNPRTPPSYMRIVNGSILKYNYCYTCGLFRPPRTSHCAACDNCCERFDHHCVWLGNCVGKRNYKFFFGLVITLNTMGVFHIVYGIVIIINKAMNKGGYRWATLACMAWCCFFDIMFIAFFIGKLGALHFCLTLQNITFYEHFKKKLESPTKTNPFYKTIWLHVYRLILQWTGKSLLNMNSEEEEEDNYVKYNRNTLYVQTS